MKNIVIVAPEQYSDLARKVSHEITNRGDFKCAYWSIDKFKDNEMTISSTQNVIFIGNQEENLYTKDYFECINSNLPDNKAGLFYGSNNSKAIVFGDGNLEQVAEFKKLYKGIKNGEIKVEGMDSTTNKSYSYIVSGLLLGAIGLGLMFVFKKVNKKNKENKLRKEQTKLALALFLLTEFNKWLNVEVEKEIRAV